MYANTILGLVAQTSIHAGASSSEAAIDLPIQREGHTDWPVVYGSGMKGALRSHFETVIQEASDVHTLFGPDTNNAADHAGALMVSDARLILLPVRSMTSHVKWVSCPALLKRLHKDMQRMGQQPAALPDLSAANNAQALVGQNPGSLYLEEFRFDAINSDLAGLVELLAKIAGSDLLADIKQNLVIVGDDQFRHLCRNAIPVQAHIALDSATKTAKTGALWYEENLPAETLMYCCLSCSAGRKRDNNQSGASLLAILEQGFSQGNFIQVGGNLTTGSGWFEVNWCEVTA
jgi:CRISPR-associated protein Cmr4